MKVTTKRIILFSVLATLLLLALAVFFTVRMLQKPSREEPHVQTGSIDFYLDFPSRWIEPRCVSVWLPEGYETGEPCNVIYMHDGKMLFDRATAWNHKEWDADHYRSLVFPGHSHTETDWSARLDQPLRFLCRSGGAKRLSKIFYNFALDPYSRNHETITNDSCRPPVSGRLQEHRQSKYK